MFNILYNLFVIGWLLAQAGSLHIRFGNAQPFFSIVHAWVLSVQLRTVCTVHANYVPKTSDFHVLDIHSILVYLNRLFFVSFHHNVITLLKHSVTLSFSRLHSLIVYFYFQLCLFDLLFKQASLSYIMNIVHEWTIHIQLAERNATNSSESPCFALQSTQKNA